MSVAAWAASIRGLESPPSSAPGDWNRPAIDVRHTVWDMQQSVPYVYHHSASLDILTLFALLVKRI